jgi:hypothetical protein
MKPNKMRKTFKISSSILIITATIYLMAFSGCTKDKTTPPRSTSYDLNVKDVLGVTGKVTFTETSSTLTTIDISLTNAPTGTHPAQLCSGPAVEGGLVIIDLNPVDVTGKSSTVSSTLTYDKILTYDGFVKVLKSSTEMNVILAQGDIGGNVLTAINKSYPLDTIGSFGVSGTALFQKRVNGNTLLTISLAGTIAGQSYPSSINLGSIESVGGGPVKVLLNNVDGTTGKSYTNIKKLDDNQTLITYDNWLVYDGYINIYQNSVSLANVICHGNIGSN